MRNEKMRMKNENENEIDTDAAAAGAAAAAADATTAQAVVKTEAAAEAAAAAPAAAAAAAPVAAPAAAPVSEENFFGTLNLHFLVFVTLFLHGGVGRNSHVFHASTSSTSGVFTHGLGVIGIAWFVGMMLLVSTNGMTEMIIAGPHG